MVYNTLKRWVCGFCPSSDILHHEKNTTFRETGSASVFGWGEGTPTLLGSLGRANLNHYTQHSKCPLVLSWNGNSPSSQTAVLLSHLDFLTRNPVILGDCIAHVAQPVIGWGRSPLTGKEVAMGIISNKLTVLIIGFCILLRVILTVNNTFCFATIDKVFIK
jgi:hypothetical protein